MVYDALTGLLLVDLVPVGKRALVAKGGKGGRGNLQFTSSVRQAPDFAEPGEPGQNRKLKFQLKLIADVGLIGKPNAGKSTLLSRLSAARPKIADYPFTTLKPQLGIAELDMERRLVLADIPGLIEGASEGAGLGLDFLRHIERTRVLVHLLDMVPMDETSPIDSYHAIREELFAYSPKLAAKPEILVANKMDLTGASEALADLRSALPGKQILAISAATGTGLRPLLEDLWQLIIATPASEAFAEAPPSIALNLDGPRESSATLADAQLAAEVEAIKADDVRKGKYYRRTKADRTRDRNKKRLS
jgi:GTP-binding protein